MKSGLRSETFFKGNQNPALEGEDIEELSGLVAKASGTLTETVKAIANRRNCVSRKNKPSFLTGLSSVIKEVSGIIGNVTGPYGMAVNLGGNLLAGAISGIDEIFQRNRFNFKNHEQEILFMNQYSAYAEIQKDANDYLNLETRQEELDKLDEYLDVKMNDLVANCPHCVGIKKAWQAREEANQKLYKNELGDYMQKSLDRKKWIRKERNNVRQKLKEANLDISTGHLSESDDDDQEESCLEI